MPLSDYLTASDAERALTSGGKNLLQEMLNLPQGSTLSKDPLLIECLDRVNSVINVHVFGVLETPLEEVPAILRGIGVSLLKAFIADARPDLWSEAIADGHDRAMRMLEDIRDKKLSLTFPPTNRTENILEPQLFTMGASDTETNNDTFKDNLDAY